MSDFASDPDSPNSACYSDDFDGFGFVDSQPQQTSIHSRSPAVADSATAFNFPQRSQSPKFSRQAVAHNPLLSPTHSRELVRSDSNLLSALDLRVSSSLPTADVLRHSYQQLLNKIEKNWDKRKAENEKNQNQNHKAGANQNSLNHHPNHPQSAESHHQSHSISSMNSHSISHSAGASNPTSQISKVSTNKPASRAKSAKPDNSSSRNTSTGIIGSVTSTAPPSSIPIHFEAESKHLQRLKVARTRDQSGPIAIVTRAAANRYFSSELDRATRDKSNPGFSGSAPLNPGFHGKQLPAAPQNVINPSRVRSTVDNRMPEYILRVLNSRKVRKNIFGNQKQKPKMQAKTNQKHNQFAHSQGIPASEHRSTLTRPVAQTSSAVSSVPPLSGSDFSLADSLVADRELEELLLSGRIADSPDRKPIEQRPNNYFSKSATINATAVPNPKPLAVSSNQQSAGQARPAAKSNSSNPSANSTNLPHSHTSIPLSAASASKRTSSAVDSATAAAVNSDPENVDKMKREMFLLRSRIAALEQANKQLKTAAPILIEPQNLSTKPNPFLSHAAQNTLFQRLQTTKRVAIGNEMAAAAPQRAKSAARNRTTINDTQNHGKTQLNQEVSSEVAQPREPQRQNLFASSNPASSPSRQSSNQSNFSSSETSAISIKSSLIPDSAKNSENDSNPPSVRVIAGQPFVSPRSPLEAKLAAMKFSPAQAAGSPSASAESHSALSDEESEFDESEYEASEMQSHDGPTAAQLRFLQIAENEAKRKAEIESKPAQILAPQPAPVPSAQPFSSMKDRIEKSSLPAKVAPPHHSHSHSDDELFPYSDDEQFDAEENPDEYSADFMTSPAPPKIHLEMPPPTPRFAETSPKFNKNPFELSKSSSSSPLSRSNSNSQVSSRPSSKLDIASLKDGRGQTRFIADPLSDSFEITDSGAFKRGDFILTRLGLQHNGRNSEPASNRSASSSSSSLSSHRTEFLLNADDFYILSVLGRGASAVVYRCVHGPSLSQMALKSISIAEKDKRQQLGRELSTLLQLRHPNLIQFRGAYFDQQQICIALEYMNRGSLQDLIEWQKTAIRIDAGESDSSVKLDSIDSSRNLVPDPLALKSLFPERFLSFIFEQIFCGLEFIHSQHRCHRDLKPHNLLWNDKFEFRISDYGIMGEFNESDRAAELCKTFVGTLNFMSPERIHGAKYSYSADIWATGLTLLTAIVGYFPIKYTGHWQLLQAIQAGADGILAPFRHILSPALNDFLSICLQPEPQNRLDCTKLLEHQFFSQFRSGGRIEPPVKFLAELEMQRNEGIKKEKQNTAHNARDREKEGKHKENQIKCVGELIARSFSMEEIQLKYNEINQLAEELEFPSNKLIQAINEAERNGSGNPMAKK